MASYDMAKRGREARYRYLRRCIREDICKGKLAAGARLPSKRLLASELDVSVNTVERAYGLLASEGYIIAHPGSGFTVSPGKVDSSVVELDRQADAPLQDVAPLIGARSANYSLELFPFDTWARLMRQVVSERNADLLGYVPFNGIEPLRQAISLYLFEAKGISAPPSRIVVGAGTEYLFDRLLQLFGSQSIIGVEDPGYRRFTQVARANEALWEYIPLDEEGLRVDALRRGHADIVHVSPANQFPTGVVMSQARRKQLLDWAAEEPGRYIVEDDYDSEIRHNGHALPPLVTQSVSNNVIYLNTFSKTLVPSIRISYMVLPENLMKLYSERLSLYTCSVSGFEQLALARFISEGYFERHIARLQRYYRDRMRQVAGIVAASKVSGISSVHGGGMGTHFILHVRTAKSDHEIKERCAALGFRIALLADYCSNTKARNAGSIVVNVAALTDADASRMMGVLEEVFDDDIAAATATG